MAAASAGHGDKQKHQGAELALDAADPEPAGHADRVEAAEVLGRLGHAAEA